MSNQSPEHFGRNFPAWLVLMAFITAIGPIAIDMYLPAFPAMAQTLDTTPGHIERTLAGYLFGLSIAQLFYGPISDRFGRRLPLLDRKSTRLNSSHVAISYAVFCLKKKT